MLYQLDPLVTGWVATTLAAMQEPLELQVPSGGSAYRLLLLPAFHAPTLVRIDRGAAGWQITGKQTSRQFIGLSILVWSRQRVLRPRESTQIERLVDELNLWALSVTDDVLGLDGETWILEGKDLGRYHCIKRWCPQYPRDGPALLTLGRYLMTLARVPDDSPVREGGAWLRNRIEHRRASERVAAERERLHRWEMAKRNVFASQLALELETGGLTCPHCGRHSRDVRYVHGRIDAEWYFICRACGCSFTARDRLTGTPRSSGR
jgi:hypothetical protein